MEQFIRDYLRLLDIDPFGCFIRLINISYDQSIDLSNITIRQWRHDILTNKDMIVASFTFPQQIRPLLRSREVVTIYSKSSQQFKFNIQPYLFIADHVRQWFIDDGIRTDISIDQTIYQSDRFSPFSSSDIPTLFLNRPIDSERCPRKSISFANRYARFIFPYCLSNDDIANPHTSAVVERCRNQFERNSCYASKQSVKLFNSYPRRLTTALPRIQSTKIT